MSSGVHSSQYLVFCENCERVSQDFKRCDSCKESLSEDATVIMLNSYGPNSMGQEEVIVSSIGPAVKNPGVTKVGRKRKATDCTTLSSDEKCDAPLSMKLQVPTFNYPATPISDGHFETPVGASVVMQNALNVSPFLTDTIIRNQLPVVPGLPSIPVGISDSRSRTICKKKVNPEELIAELEGVESIEDITKLKRSIIVLDCRSIRVGSYKVADLNAITRRVVLCPKGFLFSLPHCVTGDAVKLVVPLETIMNVKVCYKKLSVIFITTAPELATWMRQQLGMGLGSQDEYYFCPLSGTSFQKNIIFLLDNVMEDVGRGMLCRMFEETMTELDYSSANKMLVKANTYPKTRSVVIPICLRNNHISPSPLPSALAHSPSTSQNTRLLREIRPKPDPGLGIQKTIVYTNHKAIVQNPVQSSVTVTPASQPQSAISNQSQCSSKETSSKSRIVQHRTKTTTNKNLLGDIIS